MSSFDDLPSLKRKVEKLQREKDKADGACEQLLKRIREEFGCKTIEDAEAKLADLQTGELESFKIYNRKKAKFEKRWKKVLKGVKDE